MAGARKLSVEDVMRIKSMYHNSISQRKIAVSHGVSQAHVSNIIWGIVHRDVPWPNGRVGSYEEAYETSIQTKNASTPYARKYPAKGFDFPRPLGFGPLPEGTRLLDGSIKGAEKPKSFLKPTPREQIESMDPNGPDAQAIALIMAKDRQTDIDNIEIIWRDENNKITDLYYKDQIEREVKIAKQEMEERSEAKAQSEIKAILDRPEPAEEPIRVISPWEANYIPWSECVDKLGSDHELVQALEGETDGNNEFLKRAVGIVMVSLQPEAFSGDQVLKLIQKLASELESTQNGKE